MNRLFAVAGLVIGIGAGLTGAMAAERAKRVSWADQMKELTSALGDLLVDASSDSLWNNPKSFARINREAARLASLAHGLDGKDPKGPAMPDQDQSLKIIGGLFAKESALMAKLLAQGHRSYARDRFRAMTGYCMACHTRIPAGNAWSAGTEGKRLSSLSSLEKAHYLASTRQFDRALDDYERITVSDANSVPSVFDRERALRAGLAIAVRVKQDPERAMRLVQAFLKVPNMPEYLREVVLQWKTSIEEWKSEIPRRRLTEEGLFAEATRLLADARRIQKAPTDRSGEVLYLRVSAVVHELLAMSPNGAHAAEALLMAGMSYDVLDGLHLWDLQEPYYLACIQRVPHTELARQCYRRYEESVLLGFTGSAGADIPEDIRQRLETIKLEAWPRAGAPKPN